MKFEQWKDFQEGDWSQEINVRNFIQMNYTPYEGDSSFLADATEKTQKLWDTVLDLYKKEKENGGVLEISNDIASTISSHDAGYINKDLEQIVGLQTEKPLKRAIMPNGGIRIVEKSCEAYNTKVSEELENIYHNYRRTHNDGVFTAYTPEIRAARSSHLITGLPDGYGRGRIIGDFRRVALYGVDALINEKKQQFSEAISSDFTSDIIREREEIYDQIQALEKNFDLLFVRWVPRNQNKEANHHAKNALYKITQTNKKKLRHK